MLRTALITMLLLTLGLLSAEEKAKWFTDYQAALAEATRNRRPLLLDFTGSDWCGWCKKLKAEVFDTPAFAAWAQKNVVLVEVDFPHKHPLSPAMKKQNDELKDRFSIKGFPSIILLDPSGAKQLGKLGYHEGGPAPWTGRADKLLTAK